jgi:hypothetical protein
VLSDSEARSRRADFAKKISFVKVAGIGFHAKAQRAQRKPKSFLNLASFAALRARKGMMRGLNYDRK